MPSRSAVVRQADPVALQRFRRVRELEASGLWCYTVDGWHCNVCGHFWEWARAVVFQPSWILRHFDSAHAGS